MPNTDQHEDKRRFSRISFEAGVLLTKDEIEWRSKLFDVSLNGLLIHKPKAWDAVMGERYEAEIIFADSGSLIHAQVAVAHEDDERVGFEIVNIDVESVTHLRRLLELNLADTELLNRELSALHWK